MFKQNEECNMEFKTIQSNKARSQSDEWYGRYYGGALRDDKESLPLQSDRKVLGSKDGRWSL